jgi:hypothetical protein
MAQEIVNQHLGLIRIDPEYRDGCRMHLQFNYPKAQADRTRSAAHG